MLARLFCILRYMLEGLPNKNNKHVLVFSEKILAGAREKDIIM